MKIIQTNQFTFIERAEYCGEGFYYCLDLPDPPCIEREKICNGIKDCSDGSDESACDSKYLKYVKKIID